MTELIAEISCEDDDGAAYTVLIFQEFKSFRPLNGPAQKVPGLKSAYLAGSMKAVNVIDGNEMSTFKIVESDRIIRRVSD
ncbi:MULTISPECIES: hypothetical protein [unclassified Sulfitobacter]|uniref:hypothetical protein n=1 Tax=unclassified Sulfitobacter TaxID=196795 RepID=UPI0007C28A12|nr:MULTISPECIES: hypothetical protein [unclassified Sulfitobacter]KZX99907.1 hypothetical protein A3720_11760 [Sulfitobacter sp. HI0021]KZY00164.1 hypothetical protein A3722_11430 [Sulfitobacter sp. HI0027]KZZ02631.1 hypothetical protein A3747_14865 [Sulfitobacter sp. HI0076]